MKTLPKFYIDNGTFPLDDYEALMKAASGCKDALEFGPGHSTRALIAAGCKVIHSYEHDHAWLMKATQDLAPIASRQKVLMRIMKYYNEPELQCMFNHEYDIAIVDSPKGGRRHQELMGQPGLSRFNTLQYALKHSRRVLLHDCDREGEQRSIEAAGCTNITKLTDKLWMVKDAA